MQGDNAFDAQRQHGQQQGDDDRDYESALIQRAEDVVVDRMALGVEIGGVAADVVEEQVGDYQAHHDDESRRYAFAVFRQRSNIRIFNFYSFHENRFVLICIELAVIGLSSHSGTKRHLSPHA